MGKENSKNYASFDGSSENILTLVGVLCRVTHCAGNDAGTKHAVVLQGSTEQVGILQVEQQV